MTYSFRPPEAEQIPLIIGIAGPTKSGKTYSAHRLARGLAGEGTVAMINAEGVRGHQYRTTFTYVATELEPPYRPTSYTEALKAAAAIKPAVVIIDSGSHMHDGPGGILEWHEQILDKMAGTDHAKRQRSTFTAWVEPKAAENQFIYQMLSMKVPVILCLRAKEKIKIVPGKDPIDLGWQPIVGERVAFETIFTLMLPPHSKGVPDLTISDMREPFDQLVPKGKQIDEDLGRRLAAWAAGRPAASAPPRAASQPASAREEAKPPATTPPTPSSPPPSSTQPAAAGQQPGLAWEQPPAGPARAEGEEHPLFSEREDKLAALDRVRGSLSKPVPDDVWKALCKELCGGEDLAHVELATLDDLYKLVDGISKKDPASIRQANDIVEKSRARVAS